MRLVLPLVALLAACGGVTYREATTTTRIVRGVHPNQPDGAAAWVIAAEVTTLYVFRTVTSFWGTEGPEVLSHKQERRLESVWACYRHADGERPVCYDASWVGGVPGAR